MTSKILDMKDKSLNEQNYGALATKIDCRPSLEEGSKLHLEVDGKHHIYILIPTLLHLET